ncbi:MAG: DUF6316 family protein [Gammaproteobacteria bacterium]|nr:DUF6316 family protein [Gammaproteobacteria bacterium]
MDNVRSGETNANPFRTDRSFCSNGEWYFLTRGGGQVGPFISKEEMEAELLLFIRDQAMAKNAITN